MTNIMSEEQNPPVQKSEVEEARDSGTKVEDGIVIEDDNGNQFVWIPTGTYQTTDGSKTNELTRRQWATANTVQTPTPITGDDVIDSYYYGEGDSRSVAYGEIDAFLESARPVSEGGHGGFYIGRYEAGTATGRTAKTDPLTTPLVQANKYPYVYVTRDQAKAQAEAMYAGNTYVTSQLISSYAWDTALNFICQTNEGGYLLASTDDSTYGNIATGPDISNRTQTGMYTVEGEISDKYSNIHDILGNCEEWTTEYSTYTLYSSSLPCVFRGGAYDQLYSHAKDRDYGYTSSNGVNLSFRLQLYINTESL